MSAPFGSILDVPGIGVGHHQRISSGWQSGTTVVTCRRGATPGGDVRGGGPGTRETDALRPENLIQEIHAVCLTGGSAFGLAAADGVMQVLETERLGFPIGDGVVPVVPTAVIFDLGRGGSFSNRPDATFGERAARRALRGRRAPVWGTVGAGTGATAGGLQGGVGTASAVVTIPLSGPPGQTDQLDDLETTTVVVGALAVVNANGSPVDPETGLPWEPSGMRLTRPSPGERSTLHGLLSPAARGGLNTTIGVVATSARLDKAEASKVAAVAHDGLARAIRPAHAMVDGDTVFTLATGDVELPGHPVRIAGLDAILRAAADTFAAACTHATLAATTVGEAVAWSDVCPSSAKLR